MDGQEQPTTPEAPAQNLPAAETTAAHVEQAAGAAEQTAQRTGDDGWKTVAEELKGLRGDIRELMDQRTAATPAPSSALEPETDTPDVDVDVEVPKPPERVIRRNGRKVKRRG